MGNPHSTPEKQVEDRSAHVAHYVRLYQELTAADDTGAAPDDKTFKVSCDVHMSDEGG